MQRSHSSDSTLERVLTEQHWVRQSLVLILVLGTWIVWTIWSDADWFYQALFIFLMTAVLILIAQPAWILNFMLILLVGDVSGYITGMISIPGFIGIVGMGGRTKIPELLSVLAVFHMIVYACLRPQEFRQPLVRNVILFILAGMISTALGVRNFIPTNALRDSLGYYFSAFYIVGLVLLPTARAAKGTFRVFYITALLALLYCFVFSALTSSTRAFYPATVGMFFSTCAYFLAAKLFSSPQGSRRWLTLVMLLPFSAAMFIGRSRGAVIAFVVGLLPLFFALPGRYKFRLVLGLLVPCVLLMLVLFGADQRRGQYDAFGNADPGARGLESFTEMGNKDYDTTGSYRIYMWKMAWDAFLEEPVLGKGYGWRVPLSSGGALQEEVPASAIHNSYIHVLACGGLVGIIPLIFIVIRFFLLCGREYWQRTQWEYKLWPACAASIGLNFFLTCFTNVGMEEVASGLTGWVLLAMAVRMATTPGEELKKVIWRGAAEDAPVILPPTLPAIARRQVR